MLYFVDVIHHLRWGEIVGAEDQFHVALLWKGRSSPVLLHDHDFPEVFFVTRGETLHEVNGWSHVVREGEGVFIRPQDRHELKTTRGSFELFNFAFPPEVLDHLRSLYFSRMDRWFWSRETRPEVLRLDPEQREALLHWAEILLPAPRTALYRDRFLLELFFWCTQGSPSDSLEGPSWLVQSLRMMREPQFLVEGVPRLVQLCGRSPEYVARTMRRHLGCTPTDYVNTLRLDRAERLLQNTSMKVTDIAFDCGFENLPYFYRLFRRRNGMAPGRYRRLGRWFLRESEPAKQGDR
ncbi:MAG TPA: AraC family transcriptional regulator [Acidobacteriota bacterium]|nr:AraC family transcriptional regulator [Acidobacteriota bacterium]HRR26979.1 AraC family transcriptional regulator [Acidobacteriota bacterium]HRV08789.1 AraC family transcriptional regulator [Acidobacteriota bacterium]